MAGFTVGTAAARVESQLLNQGVKQVTIVAAAAAGDSTTVIAAGATGTYNLITAIQIAADGAEEIALLSAGVTLLPLYMPLKETYLFKFDPPLQCAVDALFAMDKGTTSAVTGLVTYANIKAGQAFRA